MKIDIKDNSNESILKLCGYPLDCEYFGEDESDEDLKIFIHQETITEVDKYLSSDLNNELGGVLLGDACINKNGKKFIIIDNLIIAKHSNSSLSRLTFTHETWDYINSILEKYFPDKKILGWFHSHPGHTVFLSNFDLFIQENFFNMEYMVAYVFDPTIKDKGFFHWRDKKTVKSNGYYICNCKNDDEFNEIITVNSNEDLLASHDVKKEWRLFKKNKGLITITLLLFTLLILLFMIYNIYEIKQKALLKEEYEKDLTEIRNENRKLTERLNDLILETEYKKALITAGKNNETPDQLNTEGTNTETQNTVNEDHIKNPGISSGENVSTNKDNSGEVIKYKVKSGDTLEKISNLFYKNRAGIELIMKHNNLKNKTDIKIGQEIEIP